LFNSFISYLELNQPIATVLTGTLAVFAVVLSQIWLDLRQKRDHKHEVKLKGRELTLSKKEELIENINLQVKDITRVDDLFESWFQDFQKNYSSSEINQLLRDIDNRVNKIHIIIQLYFNTYEPYITKIINEAEDFHVLCADYSMAGKFGEEKFLELEPMELIRECSSYSVGYMQLSSHLINPEYVEKYKISSSEPNI